MDNWPENLDWSLVPAFVAVAEAGSLSGAARRLDASQPTIGRRIQALEKQLGATLFQRHARGFSLTTAGAALLPAAREMRDAAGTLTRISAGHEARLAGTVRLTASLFMAHHVLPAILVELRRAAPRIAIDLVASDSSENLLFGEADIAVRMYRPTQLDVVAKHLGDIPLGMFAAQSYLERRGQPKSVDDMIAHHDLIGYDRDEQILRGMRQMGLAAQRDWFTLRCDNHPVYWQLLRAGGGIGFCQTNIANDDPLVRRVLPDLPIPPLPVWLTAHRAMRQTPRIARVWKALQQGLGPFVS